MKRILNLSLLLLGLFVQPKAEAQDIVSTIRGSVIDRESRAPLPLATVLLIGSDPVNGTTTDFDGQFRLENVPVGRQAVRIELLGYKPVTLPNLLVVSAKALEVNVELEEAVLEMGSAEITAEVDKREAANEMAVISSRVISTEEMTRFSGSLLDPARMAQNYAGISGANDQRNDIIIRGNSPSGVLWRMEGIDIPSPNHFATLGTTGGPVGMLNINNLQNSDFLTGAWSADYGNAMSGVFDLKLRNGNRNEHEFLGQIGFNGFEVGLEGPFKSGGRATYLANYRYSTLGVFDAIGIDLGTGAAVPEYQDLTFKVDLPTEKAGRFSLWGIGGLSYIEFTPPEEGEESDNLFAGDDEENRFESNTGVAGLSHTYFYDEKTYSKVVLAASAVQTTGEGNTLLEGGGRERDFSFDRTQLRYSAHAKVNRKFNAKTSANAGVIAELFDIDFLDSVRNDLGVYYQRQRFTGSAPLIQSYVQAKHKFNESATLIAGLHSQHFTSNGSHALEPRVALRYALNEKQTLTFGSGVHSQTQPIVTYYITPEGEAADVYPNEDLGFSRSLHNVLGYERGLGKNGRLKLETYFQYLFDIPVDTLATSFSMINEGADFVFPTATGLTQEGTGQNYGLEITLERFFNQGWYFLMTTSLFESTYKGSDGIERNTAFNTNYVFNMLSGKEWILNDRFTLTLDGKITVSGGRPVTPVDLEASNAAGFEIRDDSQAFSERLDDFLRFDLKFGLRANGKNLSQEFFVDLQNLTNRDNVFLQGYDENSGGISTTYQRGFFPNVFYRVYF